MASVLSQPLNSSLPRVLEKWVLGCRLLEFIKAKHILILEVKEGAVHE